MIVREGTGINLKIQSQFGHFLTLAATVFLIGFCLTLILLSMTCHPVELKHILCSKTGDFQRGGRRAVRGWSVPFRFSGNPEGCMYWYKVLLALSRKLILCFLFPNLQLCVVKTSLVLWTMYRPCPVSCEMSWVSVHTISLQHGTSW